jgi:endonuclease/exonuclease/phosphatase family metal-dependent hydrolase
MNRRTVHMWSGSNVGPAKIDHVFVSRGAEVLAAAVQKNRDPVVSDHHAVSARVIFPATGDE